MAVDRRIGITIERYVGRAWEQCAKNIEDVLKALTDSNDDGLPVEHQETHLAGGADALQTPGTPTTVEGGVAASPGDGPSYAYEDHRHPLVLPIDEIRAFLPHQPPVWPGPSTAAAATVSIDEIRTFLPHQPAAWSGNTSSGVAADDASNIIANQVYGS